MITPVNGPSLPKARRVEGEVLVRLKGDSVSLTDVASEHGAHLLKRYQLPATTRSAGGHDILKLQLPQGTSVDDGIKDLQKDPRVQYACSNDILRALDVPNDLDEKLWGMPKISAPQAWDTSHGSRSGPVIAVIDGGVDYNHPDLSANIWNNPGETANGADDDHNGVVDDLHGFNAVKKTGDPIDDSGHGTHCAGTIGAIGNNGQGVAGVNWQARIMPVKFLENGYGETADAIEGLLYATKMGARITSNSWGGPQYNQALYDALAASPALHICAAGNDNASNDVAPAYPAGYDLPNIVAVAATDINDKLAEFSNYGVQTVELAAPGVNIYSTLPNNQFGVKSGTSMACPHVSGVAGLIASQYPQATNQQIKDRLVFGVDHLSELQDKLISGGRLNAALALEDDRVAPGAVTHLQVGEGVTTVSVPLQWTATGDDGEQGKAAAYELRYSANPITEANFDQAQALRLPPPAEPGSAEQAVLPLRPSGAERNLHVALRAVDNVGNRGPLSYCTATVPAATVRFEDDGEGGTSKWTAEGTWGLQNWPGRGQVWADSPNGDYALGENASLTSQPFSLKGLKTAKLGFECRHDLEITFDKVFLEASGDGKEWKELDSYNLLTGWEEKSYDLTPYVGGDLQIRFRIKTDDDVVKDGFEFDNLVVSGEPEGRE